MKTLFINIYREITSSYPETEVFNAGKDNILDGFYISLGMAIAEGVSVREYKSLVADFATAKPTEFDLFQKQWDELKLILLGKNPEGEFDFKLSSEYLEWLKINASTVYYKKYQGQHQASIRLDVGELYEDTVDAIRRKVLRFLQEKDKYKIFDEFVINDNQVNERSKLVCVIKDKYEDNIAFVPYEKWKEKTKEDVCPACGKNPCECEQSQKCPKCGKQPCECISSEGEELYMVSNEDSILDIYNADMAWGLYNNYGQLCLPISKYEHLTNDNYPHCFKSSFGWFRKKEGNEYYHLSDKRCIKLGCFASAIPLNDKYLAVKKTKASIFTCVLDNKGREVISENHVGEIKGISSEGYILCELAPNSWGLLNLETAQEYSFDMQLDFCEMNPDLDTFYIELNDKRGYRKTGFVEPYCILDEIHAELIEYNIDPCHHFDFGAYNRNPSLYGKKKRIVSGTGFYNTAKKAFYEFEGIHDDIAYRNKGTKADKEDYGFVYIPTATIYRKQIVMKVGNYCIVAEKDLNYRNSVRFDKCGIVDLSTQCEIIHTHYDNIRYLSQYLERPLFLLIEDGKTIILYDPQLHKQIEYSISGEVLDILYGDEIINVYYELPNDKEGLLIFNVLGEMLYHDKWGTRSICKLDYGSTDFPLLSNLIVYESGKLLEKPRKYMPIQTENGKGVRNQSGTDIVPFKYKGLKVFRPLELYCRAKGIALFTDNWNIIENLII